MRRDYMVKNYRVTEKVCVRYDEKDKHHRTLCPKRFKNKDETKTNNAIVADGILFKEVIPKGKTTMLETDEHDVMQTALVEATSTDQMFSEVTRMLMDIGSSRIYVTDEIVNKTKLQTHELKELTIYTFRVSKLIEIM